MFQQFKPLPLSKKLTFEMWQNDPVSNVTT